MPELIEAATRCARPDIAAGSRALLSEGSEAERHYLQAKELLAQTRNRSALARTQLLYGEWLRRENRRLDARVQLHDAYEALGTMGIAAFAERARRELVATGERVHKRAAPTIDALTAQEAQIAELAVSGRTNPEIGAELFLSPRTVEWHLRKVYSTLGVTSLRQLRAARSGTGWIIPRV